MDTTNFDRAAAAFVVARDRRGVLRLLGAAIARGGALTLLASDDSTT